VIKQVLAAMAISAFAGSSYADILAQWTFNSPTPDANTSTGSLIPSIGAGTLGPFNGVTNTFSDGRINGGSSDPGTTDNSSLFTTNYASWPFGGGIIFRASTAGYTNITISYDIHHSPTSSRYEAVRYSPDGINMLRIGAWIGDSGDTWFHREINLDPFFWSGSANNSSFAIMIHAEIPSGSQSFLASDPASTFSSTGSWAFDMITISGTPTLVPEGGTFAMFTAGLAACIGTVLRRKRLGLRSRTPFRSYSGGAA